MGACTKTRRTQARSPVSKTCGGAGAAFVWKRAPRSNAPQRLRRAVRIGPVRKNTPIRSGRTAQTARRLGRIVGAVSVPSGGHHVPDGFAFSSRLMLSRAQSQGLMDKLHRKRPPTDVTSDDVFAPSSMRCYLFSTLFAATKKRWNTLDRPSSMARSSREPERMQACQQKRGGARRDEHRHQQELVGAEKHGWRRLRCLTTISPSS